MSGACRTCRERPARYANGECEACWVYRHRTGRERPFSLIRRHAERRARRVAEPAMPPSFHVVHELLATMPLSGRVVLSARSHQPRPAVVEVCGACGTIRAWPQGRPWPLCVKHRAVLGLAGLMLDDAEAQERLLELVTA